MNGVAVAVGGGSDTAPSGCLYLCPILIGSHPYSVGREVCDGDTDVTTHDEWTDTQTSHHVTVDGHDLEVAYYDSGAGDPVVFLHRIPTNSFLWRDVLSPIEAERRVIAPDMIGYGNPSMYDGFDRSLRAQEGAIEEALDLGTVTLVGHDLGGGVFLRYAAHNPGAVDKLVLSTSVTYDSWPIQTITDLGLPETAREASVEELQGMLDGLMRDTLYGDDASEEFIDGMKAS